jgi:hypothetical protein
MACFEPERRSCSSLCKEKAPKVFPRIQGFYGKSPLEPAVETAGQGTDSRDAHALEQKRRTGAPHFAGSVTAHDDVAVPRDLVKLLFQLIKGEEEGARDGERLF